MALVKGQVTIEFILILVVMLTILTTISIPLINAMRDEVSDVSIATSLASSVYSIRSAGEELSLAGCHSFKDVTVFVDNSDPFTLANVTVNNTDRSIYGQFILMNGSVATVPAEVVSLPAGVNASYSGGSPVGAVVLKSSETEEDSNYKTVRVTRVC